MELETDLTVSNAKPTMMSPGNGIVSFHSCEASCLTCLIPTTVWTLPINFLLPEGRIVPLHSTYQLMFLDEIFRTIQEMSVFCFGSHRRDHCDGNFLCRLIVICLSYCSYKYYDSQKGRLFWLNCELFFASIRIGSDSIFKCLNQTDRDCSIIGKLIDIQV